LLLTSGCSYDKGWVGRMARDVPPSPPSSHEQATGSANSAASTSSPRGSTPRQASPEQPNWFDSGKAKEPFTNSWDMDVPVRRSSSLGVTTAGDAPLGHGDGMGEGSEAMRMEKELEQAHLALEVLEPPFTLFALEPGRLLDGRISAMSEAMRRTNWASVFYTSTPLTAGLSKPAFQGVIALIGLWFLVMASLNTIPREGQPSIPQPLCRSSSFRFVPLQLRDGTSGDDIKEPGIEEFGLTLDGVPLEKYLMEKAVQWNDGREMHLTFNETILFNGWYLVTSRGKPDRDPLSFELMALNVEPSKRQAQSRLESVQTEMEEGFAPGEGHDMRHMTSKVVKKDGNWVRVGASGWFFFGSLDIQGKGTKATDNIPHQRRRRIIFDYGLRWEAVMNDCVVWIVCGIGTLAAAHLGCLHRERQGKMLLGSAFILLSTTLFSKMAFLCSTTLWDFALILFLFGFGLLSAAYVFLMREDLLLLCMVGGGWYFLIIALIDVLVVQYGGLGWLLSFIILFILLTGFGTYGFKLRNKHVRDAWRLIEPDKRVYDEIWRKLTAEQGTVEALAALAAQVQRVAESTTDLTCRQLNRQRLERSEGTKRRMFSCQSMLPPVREASELHGGGLMFRGRAEGSDPRVSSFGSSAFLNNRVHSGSEELERDLEQQQQSPPALDKSTSSGRALPTLQKTDSVPHVLGPDYLHYTTIKGTVDPQNPVSSLDQLYLQASGASPTLRGYTLKWASKSNGMLHFRRPAAFVGGADGHGSGVSTGKGTVDTFESWKKVPSCRLRVALGGPDFGVRWAKIKAPERASEKVLRSYKGDVSRLLDICRQSIVFRTLADMTACLCAIIDDPEVRVVRVKNRMSPDFDPRSSGGYRDVVVNLRMVSEATSRFGVDTHVCELQLLLLEFAMVKSDAGHKRYVQFRNTKGE